MRQLRHGGGWLPRSRQERDRSVLPAVHHELERIGRAPQLRPVLRLSLPAHAGGLGRLPRAQSAAGRVAPAAAAEPGESAVQPDPAPLRQAEHRAQLPAAIRSDARGPLHLQGRSRHRQFPDRPKRQQDLRRRGAPALDRQGHPGRHHDQQLRYLATELRPAAAAEQPVLPHSIADARPRSHRLDPGPRDPCTASHRAAERRVGARHHRPPQPQRQRRHDHPLRLEGAEQVDHHLRGRGLQRRDGDHQRGVPDRDRRGPGVPGKTTSRSRTTSRARRTTTSARPPTRASSIQCTSWPTGWNSS